MKLPLSTRVMYSRACASGKPTGAAGTCCRADGRWELEGSSAEFLEPSAKKSLPPEGLVPQYPQRAPLKRSALPNLVAKALASLEAAPGLDVADALPAELRAQHGFPPWHEVGWAISILCSLTQAMS